ncbi:VWA domain-containing protein [Castellaniella sp.]|uniref:vWA domain-containing protein n=1 Tax=Castellaniella sp. TaxID=1955812 RepID=UPI00355D82AF
MKPESPSSSGPQPHWVSQLGDARRGKLAGNIAAFGRALRRAGLPLDSARIALAQQAWALARPGGKAEAEAVLESVLVSRQQDIAVFREMFAAFFKDPELAQQLLARMAAQPARPRHDAPRPRVQAALSSPNPAVPRSAAGDVELDAAMTASTIQRLQQADFNQLSASEYHLIERLVREIPLPLPAVASRRSHAGTRGRRLHWHASLQAAGAHGGELIHLRHHQRRLAPLPLLVLLDVSGSMERYARILLAFLHAATRRTTIRGRVRRVNRQVYAFGTDLTDLNPAFRLADTDAMLLRAAPLLRDFAGGTRLAASLATLRRGHARHLIGRRTLVLLISDGLDTGDPIELDHELQWLRRHVRQLLWLNPLLRFDGYAPLAQGAAVLHAHADAMLAIHNVSRLQALAGALAALARQ